MNNISTTPTYSRTVFGLTIVLIFFVMSGKTQATNAQSVEEQPVSLSSLLDEMVDRDLVARYPDRKYKQLQQSSYNRASKTPEDAEGWYHNIDRFEYIRIDTINGRPEWVMMDYTGPCAMTRVWMPDRLSPQAKLQGKVNEGDEIMRVYLDDNPEPVLEGSLTTFLMELSWPVILSGINHFHRQFLSCQFHGQNDVKLLSTKSRFFTFSRIGRMRKERK